MDDANQEQQKLQEERVSTSMEMEIPDIDKIKDEKRNLKRRHEDEEEWITNKKKNEIIIGDLTRENVEKIKSEYKERMKPSMTAKATIGVHQKIEQIQIGIPELEEEEIDDTIEHVENQIIAVHLYKKYFLPYLSLREAILCAQICKSWYKNTLKYKDPISLNICGQRIPKDAFHHLKYLLDESWTEMQNLVIHTVQLRVGVPVIYATNIQNKILQWTTYKDQEENTFKFDIFGTISDEEEREKGMRLPKLTNDRTVITQGNAPEKIQNVKAIVYTYRGFCVLTDEGNVITGKGKEPPTAIKNQLKNIKMIFSTQSAYAALTNEGNVIVWGINISAEIQNRLQNVDMIFTTTHDFAALTKKGKVITFGKGHTEQIPEEVNYIRIKTIAPNRHAFAALSYDGKVISWGNERCGGGAHSGYRTKMLSYYCDLTKFREIKQIVNTDRCYAILSPNGTVKCWTSLEGNSFGGRPSEQILKELKRVDVLFSNINSFAALRKDKKLFVWGDEIQNFGDRRQPPTKIPTKIQENLRTMKVVGVYPKPKGFVVDFKNDNGDVIREEW